MNILELHPFTKTSSQNNLNRLHKSNANHRKNCKISYGAKTKANTHPRFKTACHANISEKLFQVFQRSIIVNKKNAQDTFEF